MGWYNEHERGDFRDTRTARSAVGVADAFRACSYRMAASRPRAQRPLRVEHGARRRLPGHAANRGSRPRALPAASTNAASSTISTGWSSCPACIRRACSARGGVMAARATARPSTARRWAGCATRDSIYACDCSGVRWRRPAPAPDPGGELISRHVPRSQPAAGRRPRLARVPAGGCRGVRRCAARPAGTVAGGAVRRHADSRPARQLDVSVRGHRGRLAPGRRPGHSRRGSAAVDRPADPARASSRPRGPADLHASSARDEDPRSEVEQVGSCDRHPGFAGRGLDAGAGSRSHPARQG